MLSLKMWMLIQYVFVSEYLFYKINTNKQKYFAKLGLLSIIYISYIL